MIDLQTQLSIVAAVVAVIGLIWTIWRSLEMTRRDKAAERDERLTDHERRLVRVETVLDTLPEQIASHQDVEGVHRRVERLEGHVVGVAADVATIKGILGRLEKGFDRLDAHARSSDA